MTKEFTYSAASITIIIIIIIIIITIIILLFPQSIHFMIFLYLLSRYQLGAPNANIRRWNQRCVTDGKQ